MSEQTPSAEERVIDAMAEELSLNPHVRVEWEPVLRDQLEAIGKAAVTLIDSEELARLRQAAEDRDVAMRFAAAYKADRDHQNSTSYSHMKDRDFKRLVRGRFADLSQVMDRWQAEQARGEEAGR